MGLLDSITGGDLIKAGTTFLGGVLSGVTGNSAQKREYERQKEFAQNGIRWKVQDAKAAGIHPIYAIGANTPTYSPQATVGTDYGISEAGQNIARAIEAKQTALEREENNRISRTVGEAQANYYNSAARRQNAEADLIGQRSVQEALQDIRSDTIGQQVASSSRTIRTQQLPPSLPTTKEVSTYNTPKPGIDPYIIGNTYFEAPPENIADMVENPKLFAGWKGVVEAAYVLDGKVKEDFKKILMPHHRKLIDAGTHEIIRVPGVGCAVKRKGEPLRPSDFLLNSRKHHTGGPNNIY